MARPFRTQLTYGAAFLFVLFLTAVFFASRATFLEQLDRIGTDARVIAESVQATASAGDLSPEEMGAALAHLPVPDDAVVAVIDVASGEVVAGQGAASVLASLTLDLPEHLQRLDADNVFRAYGVVWSDDRSCRVIVALPDRLAWDQTLPIYKRNAINAGLWYMVSFLTMYLFLARWVRSVQHLEGVALRVSGGDLSDPTRVPMATSELDRMQETMAEMIARVRELQHQVVRQERLAAIGVLVSGVAHEISNPLQSILGSAQIIEANHDLPDAVRKDLGVIQSEGARASSIIRNLTRFSRQDPLAPCPVRLTEIVQWLTELWRRRLESHGITLDVDDQSTRVTNAVASELQQVALNFLVNAEYAVQRVEGGERRVMLRTRDTADGMVRLEVEDTGAGIAPGDEDKLFQPFFTTKPVGDGTGLGLSVSYGIMQGYGGRVGYEPAPGGGARFFFEIPGA